MWTFPRISRFCAVIGAARCARCQERRLRRSTSTRRCNLIRLFAIAAALTSIRQRSLPTCWANDVAPAAARAAFGCRVGRTGRLLDSSGEPRSDSPCTRLPREHPPMSCWQRRRVGQSDQNDCSAGRTQRGNGLRGTPALSVRRLSRSLRRRQLLRFAIRRRFRQPARARCRKAVSRRRFGRQRRAAPTLLALLAP